MKEIGLSVCIIDEWSMGNIKNIINTTKMINRKIILTVVGLSAVGAMVLAGTDSASAFRGDATKVGPNYSVERHEAMQKALAASDYEAWKALMGDKGRVTEVITKDNFAKFVEAYKLAEQGKYAEAEAIRKELKLGVGIGRKAGMGFGRGMGEGLGFGRNHK
ncbi:MAG: hypothetical protein A2568_01765 [Candidatus Yanofskybacteria bacterium RIFOXYD1_FULL_44_17]|uniref:Uncharacterized protein n=1 Tax=Candidatus Yanofskybacteria bacterium GW2011_GWE2_40_11 TaxID=1619033 RepID=A0A0G0QM61_9BACT|nr:MAG: hypothetical protein UT75_C0001G0107 [Candidatus Yanofskybacteria bacterium GW2011_GWE2_40_11]OGN36194.1 MAG: hypothetical protein A2241_00400 [Candidatus Yanofskybacteria bacterium RIFOXYA2_FULL_45_28]OGN36910.1 MAG: hypothetical protein A2207_01050 [Candidatus Yanofskybacteria bacterium RIFOXYA1_FULL_44_17]OGN38353.1 MAG: hypothetical protein A2405_01320 [Candidatus Yanofskybacteria bacterium RIFOXYC1_FULL_44_16]OGN38531.1 MAG: hypothetical protein A2302_00445 [Candidatus Yanofskybact